MNKTEELKIVNKETFKRLVHEKSFEKYGKNIQTRIKERIDRELSLVCCNELSLYNFMIARELVERAKNHGWTVGNRGSVASSLIAHLLGITQINPLEAHYYCPNCHYVEFHDEFSCGVDMEDKVCQCGTKFEKDGFTIPPETFFGTDGSEEIDIDYNFAPEYQKEAFEHLEKEFGVTTVKGGTIQAISYGEVRNIGSLCYTYLCKERANEIDNKLVPVKKADEMHPNRKMVFPKGIDILTHDDPAIIRKLEEFTGVSAKSIPLDDKETMKIFADFNTSGISEFSTPFVRERIMKKVRPKSFDDLIRISGISHGTDTWADNAENLISEGKSISEVVSCRDDVMIALVKSGVERETAYKISESIRKGKGLTDEQYEELLNKGIESWKLDSWNKILYSFPRAHAASYVLYAYRKAYYKAHYPKEFNSVVKR